MSGNFDESILVARALLPAGSRLISTLFGRGMARCPERRDESRRERQECPRHVGLKLIPRQDGARELKQTWRAGLRFLGILALLIPRYALAANLAVARPATAESVAFARYIASTLQPGPFNESEPVVVKVDASLPALYKESSLLAVRQMGDGGEYQLLAVEGDVTVTEEVIAPYLSVAGLIETLPMSAVAVTPANYKFHYMGELGSAPASTYVFRITPKKRRDGLIEGELWIDSITGVGVLQKGYLVKTPRSFGSIQVVRDTKLLNGVPCVRVTHVTIETRLAGRGELTITEYPLTTVEKDAGSPGSNFEPATRLLRGSFSPNRTAN
jgi:hypothetical protein